MRHLALLAMLLAPALAHAAAAGDGASGVAGSSAVPGDAPDVVGGAAVPQGRWPDAVAVIGDKGTCTGTLIAPDVVLTAGHCSEIAVSEIVANTNDYGDGGESVGVKSVTAYPNWQGSFDLAVLVLDHAVTGVAPRAVGASCTYAGMAAGTMVHIVGFGLTTEAGTGTNTALHEAMAPVMDPDCMDGEGCQGSIAPGGEFVAGGGGTDSCFGDSGGPVYLDTPRGQVLVGAVSRGISGSTTPCGDGGIYERTDKVIAWIEQVAGEGIAVDSCDGSASGSNVVGEDRANATAATDSGCAAGGGTGGFAAGALVVTGGLALTGRRRRGCPVVSG